MVSYVIKPHAPSPSAMARPYRTIWLSAGWPGRLKALLTSREGMLR